MNMGSFDLGHAPGNGEDLSGLERKFARLGGDIKVEGGTEISGYASLFGAPDQGGDIVEPGAYAVSLKAAMAAGRNIKMLWQHDPTQPIGIWDEVREDERGLFVKGRLLEGVAKAREAVELLSAKAIDGLSIGYRTVRATKNSKGQRLLTELELWEVSLVTFPMLPSARVAAKADQSSLDATMRDMAAAFDGARAELARR